MSEEGQGVTAPNDDEQRDERRLPVAPVDWLLESLVADANHSEGYAVPITLVTSGGAVSGILISMKEYFLAAGLWWVGAIGEASEEYGKQMHESWTSAGEIGAVELRKRNDAEFNYIHLRNVRYLGGLVAPEPGFLWRGRISEVTGFSLGALVPQPVTLTATATTRTATDTRRAG